MAAAFLTGCAQAGDSSKPVPTQHITIPGQWVFEPKVAQVVAGEPVTWTNHGGAAHTVTIPSLGIDESLDPGESFEYVFTEPGTHDYKCDLHPPGMKGSIVVVAGPGTSPAAANTTTEPA